MKNQRDDTEFFKEKNKEFYSIIAIIFSIVIFEHWWIITVRI